MWALLGKTTERTNAVAVWDPRHGVRTPSIGHAGKEALTSGRTSIGKKRPDALLCRA